MHELLLLFAEMLVYFSAMLTVFRFRHRLGIGAFFTMLGSLYFLETYLAANLYVGVLPGLSMSPGSVVLFAGKLQLFLLVYIREDAAVVRQPIYGLFFGCLLMCLLMPLLRSQVALPLDGGPPPDVHLLREIGGLMLWGTVLLVIDCLLLILLYERWARPPLRLWALRLWLVTAAVLIVDQGGFFTVLHFALGVPFSAGLGGLVGKLGATALYSLMLAAYLRWFEADGETRHRRLGDVFDALTYRQRFEALQATAERDALTGTLQRGRFDSLAPKLLQLAQQSGKPLSLALIDIDQFKAINDQCGHAAGDQVLRDVADELRASLRSSDYVFRYGGDEFIVVAPGAGSDAALALTETMRRRVETVLGDMLPGQVTLSIGVATFGGSEDLASLLARADERLYLAKRQGRNRVVGDSALRPTGDALAG